MKLLSCIADNMLIHPGESLREVMEVKEIEEKELARRTGMSLMYVDRVISGQENITEEFAEALEAVLGVEKSFWVNLQKNYDKDLKYIEGTINSAKRMPK